MNPKALEERISDLQKQFWIGYPRAQTIIERMEGLFSYPKMHRMPNMALVGETNNGKTMLLETFFRRHAPSNDPQAERAHLPILMLQAPPEPDEGRLYTEILLKLFSSSGTRETADSKLQRIRIILTALDTRMIILDEFQNVLAGRTTKLRRFLNSIKYIGNELRIPIVVAGTLETLNALQTDPQIANRFEPAFLPKWKMDEDFLRLLVTIEPKLGLNAPSSLHELRLAQRLYDESEGTIGELLKLLRLLATQVIRSNQDSITLDMLQSGSLKKIGWAAPSIRARYER